MENLLKKELNKLKLDSSLINSFIEAVTEGLNTNGIEICMNTLKSFTSSSTSKLIISSIIKETPLILRSIPQSQYLEWVKQSYRISEVSEDLAITYVDATGGVIDNLKPRHLLDWGNIGLSLYRSSKNSTSLVNNFFKYSPSLSSKLDYEELEILNDTLKRISTRSISFSIKILDWVLKISSKAPNDLISWNRVINLVSKKLIKDFEEIFTILAESADIINNNKTFLNLLALIIDENPQIFKQFIKNSIQIFNSDHNKDNAYQDQLKKVIEKTNCDEVLLFSKNYLDMRNKISLEKFKLWFDNSSIQTNSKEKGFFSLENQKSKDLFNDLTFSVDLDIEREVLKLYCCALSGVDLAVQSSSVMVDKEIGWFNPELATTEGSTIFLPESIKRFNKKEKNFSWLKVIATHQVGHIEFGTFHFKLQKGSKFFKDLRSELKSDLEKDNKNKEITDMTNFFKFFDDVKLAQDIFSIFEAFRVDQKIIKKYLGIKNSFIDVQAACLMGRPKISSLPAREQLLELLIRFSLNDSSQKVAKKLQSSFAKLLSLISILKENDSSVEDTSEATLRAYKILKEIKNSPEGNFDDFDYDLNIEESFSDEQFESLSEFFKSQGEEIVSEDIKDIQNTEDFDLTDQQEKNTSLEDYNSPQEVEFWGEFKPELSQLLYEMGTSEAEFSDDGDLTDLSQEQLEEMLKDSVEESQKNEDDQVSESDITQNLEDALKDMQMDSNDEDQSKFADKFDHFDEDGKSLEAIEDNQYLYDEWDFRDETYKKNWCLVNEKTIGEGDLVYYEETLEKYSDIVKDIKKQFELINPETYRKIKRLQDGEEQDLDLTVEAMIDLRSGITPSEKLYWRRNKVERSIAVAFLLDMSASTAEAIDDSSSQSDEWSAPSDPEKYMEWLRKRRSQGFRRSYKRIVDLEKEGLILLLDALETLGDKYGIFGFSGYGRENVEYYTIKDLDEKFSPTIPKRIDRISPLHATRMGPAVRHCASKLMQTDERSKFIFLISDGRPQDRGYSREGVEKEYAVNDTKKALLEAKKQGITTFCLTVDKEGHDYMKSMMDDLSYEVLDDISSLPLRIPQLYKNLTSD